MFYECEEVSFFYFHLCFIRRFGWESSELFDLILFLLVLAWNPEINRWFSFLLPRRFKTLEILSLFFSNSSLWSYQIRCLWWRIWCLNCRGRGSMMMIQLWITESRHGFHGFSLNLLLEIARVHEKSSIFWVCYDFWSNWMERESFFVFVMWHSISGPLKSCTVAWPYIGCHVASEPMGTWHLDLDWPAWRLGLICKLERKWDYFAIKQELDYFEN